MAAIPFILPPAALLAAAGLASPTPRFAPATLPPLAGGIAPGLKVGEPFLRGGIRADTSYSGDSSPESPSAPGFSLTLKLSGLPKDCVAGAKWKSLRLIHQDGHVATATAERLAVQYISLESLSGDALSVSGARFLPGSLDPFSLTACRAEGVLSVAVYRWQRKAVPLEAGQQIEKEHSTFRLSKVLDLTAAGRGSGVLGDPYFGRELLHLTATGGNESLPLTWWQLQERATPECRINLVPQSRGVNGYFMEYSREDVLLPPDTRFAPMAAARLLRAVQENRVREWELHASWLEPLGSIDVPVMLEDVFIPRQQSDKRRVEDIVAALDPAKLPPAELKRAVKLALAMTQTSNQDGDSIVKAIADLLGKVPREHLPLLLDIAKDDLPAGDMNSRYTFDEPLCQRIAALMEAEDVARLQQSDPRLLRYLRHELQARKLLSSSQVNGRGWEEYNSDELQKEWLAFKYRENLSACVPLQVALRQGFTWAIPELSELAELLPGQLAELTQPFAKISDCPADPKAAIPWLQQNAARLTWDAAAKRWVLPAP